MDQSQADAVREMIAAELAGTATGIPDPLAAAAGAAPSTPETPPQPAPAPVKSIAPHYPPEVPLDEYEALMVEALGWRLESAEKTQVLLNTEKNNINKMKSNLLERCVHRLKIDLNTFNIQIDSSTKRIKIDKRG